jgi:hypothetical protein
MHIFCTWKPSAYDNSMELQVLLPMLFFLYSSFSSSIELDNLRVIPRFRRHVYIYIYSHVLFFFGLINGVMT